MLKNNITEEDLSRYLAEYFDTYGEYIPSIYRNDYRLLYLEGLKEHSYLVDSYICQFYKVYDLLKEEYDMYKAFIDVIKHKYKDTKDMTVLDVGGGIVPQLGRGLADLFKHVYVVDRNIVNKNNPDNLEVIKKDIEDGVGLPNTDLVVGLLPCEATKPLIYHACHSDSNFIVALCDCIHEVKSTKMKSIEQAKRLNTNTLLHYANDCIIDYNMGDLIAIESPYQFPNMVIGNNKTR